MKIFVTAHDFDIFIRIVTVPNSYHELLVEERQKVDAIVSVTVSFFGQISDDVQAVSLHYPLDESTEDPDSILTLPRILFRATGVILSAVGVIAGKILIVILLLLLFV